MTGDPKEVQLHRERALRQAALGRRAEHIQQGHLGPVLKRWINADVVPIADRLREVAEAYREGDMDRVATALGDPRASLSAKERPLLPLMEWCLRGSSPGRGSDTGTTFAEDIALSFMGTVVPRLAACKGNDGVTLTAALASAAEALRDTVQGQFVSSVQGAKAMQRIRDGRPEKWKQKLSLRRIATQMQAQVKPEFLAEDRGDKELELRGSRKVIHVTDYKGDIRRLEFLRSPDVVDWEIMSLCWHDIENTSESHPQRGLWLALATMLLSLAQQTGGWFEIVERWKLSASNTKRKTKLLILSDAAHAAISRDVERWVSSGFISEPMLVPPEDGDFLTVKHRKVTGQRPPKGMVTKAEGSFAWTRGACALAESPWCVNPYGVEGAGETTEPYRLMKLASHRRLGGEVFYLPVNMDFRGRIYYRTPWVTPQSDDLGKSLLMFPPGNTYMDAQEYVEWYKALVMHFSGLYGNGLDKADYLTRWAWFQSLVPEALTQALEKAESPLTFKAHFELMEAGQTNSIPIQLDGTCNGLQHLSALMRDEVGAQSVNLTEGGDTPEDIYLKVAYLVRSTWGQGGEAWASRLIVAGVLPDRKLCKNPVMVLPYGGTIEAIRQHVKAAVLDQLKVKEGEGPCQSPWHQVEEDGYGAFRDRCLEDHPLFNQDVMHLATLIHSCITPAIPRAMAAMDTLQAIGKWVGERGLSWRTGPEEGGLWVTQAKAKSARKRVALRGFHLPDAIRRMTLVTQTNEVDPRAHRTGIVANFIHSLDAEHLARTIAMFKDRGGTCVGGIHDCVMVRPSETALMHRCLREAFVEMYAKDDPLMRPVRILPLDSSEPVEYETWHDLAEAAGVSFPAPGKWDPEEVLQSKWFFS